MGQRKEGKGDREDRNCHSAEAKRDGPRFVIVSPAQSAGRDNP